MSVSLQWHPAARLLVTWILCARCNTRVALTLQTETQKENPDTDRQTFGMKTETSIQNEQDDDWCSDSSETSRGEGASHDDCSPRLHSCSKLPLQGNSLVKQNKEEDRNHSLVGWFQKVADVTLEEDGHSDRQLILSYLGMLLLFFGVT